MKVPGLIGIPTAVMVNTLTAAAFTIDQNVITICGVLLGTAGMVVAVIKYIDGRIEHKLANFETVNVLRQKLLSDKLDNIREMLTIKTLGATVVIQPKKED